jgi:hypothetical protein
MVVAQSSFETPENYGRYLKVVLSSDLTLLIVVFFVSERLKRNSMRTQATQTDVNNVARNRHSSHIPISPKSAQKVNQKFVMIDS